MNNYNEQVLNIAKANRKLLMDIYNDYKIKEAIPIESATALKNYADFSISKLKLLKSLLFTIKATDNQVACATIGKNISIKGIYFYNDYKIKSRYAFDKIAMKMIDINTGNYIRILIKFNICNDNETFFTEVYGFNEHGLLIDNNYIDGDLWKEIVEKSFTHIILTKNVNTTEENLRNNFNSYIDFSIFKTIYQPELLKYLTIKTIKDISKMYAVIKKGNPISIKYIINDNTFFGILKNMYLLNLTETFYNKMKVNHTLNICLVFEGYTVAMVHEIIDDTPFCFNPRPNSNIFTENNDDLVAEFKL